MRVGPSVRLAGCELHTAAVEPDKGPLVTCRCNTEAEVLRAGCRYGDSSDRGADEAGSGGIGNSTALFDGRWHLYTLTTMPDSSPGYRVYIDGELAGQVNKSTVLPDGSPVTHVDGGSPVKVRIAAREPSSWVLPSTQHPLACSSGARWCCAGEPT